MKQFLLLNEQIEEMKWQRKMHSYKRHNHSYMTSHLSNASCSSHYVGGSGSRSMMLGQWSRSSVSCGGAATSSATSQQQPRTMYSMEYLDCKYPSPSELSLFNMCYSTTGTLNPSALDLRLHDVTEESLSTSDLGSESGGDRYDVMTPSRVAGDGRSSVDDTDKTPVNERTVSDLFATLDTTLQGAVDCDVDDDDDDDVTWSLAADDRRHGGGGRRCDVSKKSCTLVSTVSNESSSGDSGFSDHDLTVEFNQVI